VIKEVDILFSLEVKYIQKGKLMERSKEEYKRVLNSVRLSKECYEMERFQNKAE
jgi:hypothetical protein